LVRCGAGGGAFGVQEVGGVALPARQVPGKRCTSVQARQAKLCAM
jgi:hypothetical protein